MIELRNFQYSDIPNLQKYDYCALSYKEMEGLIDTWNTKQYDGAYFEMFAIAVDDNLVGTASLFQRSKSIVSCGLEIFSDYRHKGYATSAYSKLLEIAKLQNYKIAVAQVQTDNQASIVLNKKIGFEAENYTYINKKGNPIYYFIKPL